MFLISVLELIESKRYPDALQHIAINYRDASMGIRDATVNEVPSESGFENFDGEPVPPGAN